MTAIKYDASEDAQKSTICVMYAFDGWHKTRYLNDLELSQFHAPQHLKQGAFSLLLQIVLLYSNFPSASLFPDAVIIVLGFQPQSCRFMS